MENNNGETIEINQDEVTLEQLTSILQGEEVQETPLEEQLEEQFKGEEEEENLSENIEKEVNLEKVEETTKKAVNQKEEPSQTNAIFDKAKYLLEYGVLEDSRVVLTEDEDDEGVLISEFKDISEEQLSKILDLQKEKKNKDFEEKYIPKDDLSEHSIKLINILREGGDISDIIESKEKAEAFLKKPFEGVDLKNVEEQRRIGMHYFVNNQKLSPKEAAHLLKKKEEDFELDSFSQEVVSAYQKAHEKYVTSEEQRRIEEAREAKKNTQTRSENLTNFLKENKLKKPIIDKIVSSTIGAPNEKPRVYDALEEVLKNPEENYEILLHLLDRDSFRELYNIRTQRKTTENTLKLVDTISQASKKSREKSLEDMGRTDLEEKLTQITLK